MLDSKGTVWHLDPVSSWMADSSGPRCLCVVGGAGQGKSTISAAICEKLFGLGEKEKKIVTACHFLKFSDQRRLDPIRIITSLAFQLAMKIPSFSAKVGA